MMSEKSDYRNEANDAVIFILKGNNTATWTSEVASNRWFLAKSNITYGTF